MFTIPSHGWFITLLHPSYKHLNRNTHPDLPQKKIDLRTGKNGTRLLIEAQAALEEAAILAESEPHEAQGTEVEKDPKNPGQQKPEHQLEELLWSEILRKYGGKVDMD